MKNFEKYKTAEERKEAFWKQHTENMHAYNAVWKLLNWLDLEAEEEKPLPCPFCGEEMEIQLCSEVVWYRCKTHNCYCSPCRETKVAAIEVHNRVAKRVAKAVMDAKAKEANDGR